MAEYIEKQAAIDALIEWYGCKPNDIEEFEEIIEAKPPADVRPVVRGEWIDDGCITRCKYCGEEKEFPHWRFCPNCGAYLRR